MSKILVLGGTGAIGIYIVPELLKQGHEVYVTSRSYKVSTEEGLHYIHGDAKNDTFISDILNNNYDAIVDFMIYSTHEFSNRCDNLLRNTKHYIYISSYRVFANSESPITETSPQLIDVSTDIDYLKTDEYALSKARQERILQRSLYNNWTIVRPAITYSKNRFQLGTLEANTFIYRSLHNCPVILPLEMLSKQTTMTRAGDVASMIAKIVLNEHAYKEDFNVCTSEHHTWDEVASFYKEIIGLQVVHTSLKKYIEVVGGRTQVIYDRMYNRVMDNSKIIKFSSIDKDNLKTLKFGLEEELTKINKDIFNSNNHPDYIINAKMDKVTNTRIPLMNTGKKDKILYYISYIGLDKFTLRAWSLFKKLMR